MKRLDLLVKSISSLKGARREVNCLIIGEGPEEEYLGKLVRSEGVDERVHFYGACHKEEELSDFIYAADICVAPGNVGLTAMHSLVYGTPVITHGDKCWQMPEFEAIVPEVTGDFFERDNLADLVDKIALWLERAVEGRSAIRTKCYKVIDEKYNPSHQARVIRSVIG